MNNRNPTPERVASAACWVRGPVAGPFPHNAYANTEQQQRPEVFAHRYYYYLERAVEYEEAMDVLSYNERSLVRAYLDETLRERCALVPSRALGMMYLMGYTESMQALLDTGALSRGMALEMEFELLPSVLEGAKRGGGGAVPGTAYQVAGYYGFGPNENRELCARLVCERWKEEKEEAEVSLPTASSTGSCWDFVRWRFRV